MQIEAKELHSVWDRVKEGLEVVRKYSADRWIPEDVYAAISSGRSLLHVGYLDGEYVGFVVSTPSISYDGPYLHVWAIHAHGTVNFFDEFKTRARKAGFKRLTFGSPRNEWLLKRVQQKYGFKPVQTFFELDL